MSEVGEYNNATKEKTGAGHDRKRGQYPRGHGTEARRRRDRTVSPEAGESIVERRKFLKFLGLPALFPFLALKTCSE